MTPKEQAVELVNKFAYADERIQIGSIDDWNVEFKEQAKQCAIISCQQSITILNEVSGKIIKWDMLGDYATEVVADYFVTAISNQIEIINEIKKL